MSDIVHGLTVLKWMLINRPKIPQMPHNLSAQIVCPSSKVWDFDVKRFHWASVVHDFEDKKLPGSYFLFFLDHRLEICPALQKN